LVAAFARTRGEPQRPRVLANAATSKPQGERKRRRPFTSGLRGQEGAAVVCTLSPAFRTWACLAALLLGPADPAAKDPPSAGKEKPSSLRPDEVKLPADAILVVCEKAADALRVLPQYYYAVPPQKYDALLAEIDRLNKQLQARQPAAVSEVRVSGQVKGNRAELTAVFVFTTDRDGATVTLGCRQALFSSVL